MSAQVCIGLNMGSSTLKLPFNLVATTMTFSIEQLGDVNGGELDTSVAE